jgi:hypothetical protein
MYYAVAALENRGDLTVALANGARALIEAAHGRLAARREWALNEKGLVAAAGLDDVAQNLLAAPDALTLRSTLAAAQSTIVEWKP